MISIAISYAVSYGSLFEDAVLDAVARGFAAIQLIPDQTPNLCEELTPPRRERLRQLAQDNGVSLLLHNVFYDINLTSLVPDVARAALEITTRVFELGRDIGAESVVVHPGYMFPGWRRDPKQRERFNDAATRNLAKMCEIASTVGIRVLLENGSYCLTTLDVTPPVPLHLAITPGELLEVLHMVNFRAGVCLDVNKALRSGAALDAFVSSVGAHIEQLQLSTVASRWEKLRPFLTMLQGRGFDGTIVLEGSATEIDAAAPLLRQLSY